MAADRPLLVHFSGSETNVLTELMKDGASNAEIASRLFVSIETVRSQMRTALKKAGVRSRAALVLHLSKRWVVAVDNRGRVVQF